MSFTSPFPTETPLSNVELSGKPNQAVEHGVRSQHSHSATQSTCKICATLSASKNNSKRNGAQRALRPNVNSRKLQRLRSDRIATKTLDPVEIRSIEVMMSQLRVKFVEDYYPGNIDRGRRPFESLSKNMIFNFPSRAFYASRIVNVLVDTVSLARMASTTNNEGALHQAFRMYSAALAAFRQAVVSVTASNQGYDNNLLAIAQALHFCQHFYGFGDNDTNSTTVHIRGLADMIASRGLESMTNEDDQLVLQDYQHYAIRYGLLLRRPIHRRLAEDWSKHDMKFEVPLARLNYLAIRLPNLLEEADLICQSLAVSRSQPRFSSFDIAERATAIIQQLQDQERSLQRLYAQIYPVDEEPPYWAVDVAEVDILREEMPTSVLQAFPCAFKFTSFSPAITHSRFWACLLLIRGAIAMVLNAVAMGDDWGSETSITRMQNVTECADELCQTMMFFMGYNNGCVGLIAVAANLKYVYDWYKSIGDHKKLAWCWNIGQIIMDKGICPPDLDKT